MPHQKTVREDGRPKKEGWSDWSEAMVPFPLDDVKNRAPGNHGYIVRDIAWKSVSWWSTTLWNIYEWKAEKPGRRSVVVYVGSTCRAKSGALRARINEYCRDGSHKSKLINDALRRRYTLLVRVKGARSREKAEELENALLDRYDYAWNERRNEDIRHILEWTKQISCVIQRKNPRVDNRRTVLTIGNSSLSEPVSLRSPKLFLSHLHYGQNAFGISLHDNLEIVLLLTLKRLVI